MFFPYSQHMLRRIARERQQDLIHEAEQGHLERLAHLRPRRGVGLQLWAWLGSLVARRPVGTPHAARPPEVVANPGGSA